jgi:hypothetical protein
VDALRDRGLFVEGVSTIEVSPAGQSIRAEVKFRPREGFIEKLSRVFSIKLNVSLKDIFL